MKGCTTMTTNSNHAALGQIIQQARANKAVSLRSLSATTGIPKSTLNNIEHGNIARPRSDIVAKIALALDGNPAEYLGVLGRSADTEYPSLEAYLRVRYHHLSPEGIADVQAYLEQVARREAIN